MTALKINATPDLERLLRAGRRAAYSELHVIAADRGLAVQGDSEAEYTGDGAIAVNGVDLRPMIGAVVREVVVQLGASPKRRPWWKFWA